MSVTLKEVEDRLTTAEHQLQSARSALDGGRCYCEMNSYEHRGACNYHENLARWRRVVKIGRDLLVAPLETFAVEAPDFVKNVDYVLRLQ